MNDRSFKEYHNTEFSEAVKLEFKSIS